MRTNLDLAPFRRATVGFDRLFDLLENGTSMISGENYPPFDLEQDGEDRYRITLAVAGFRPDEIDVTAQQNLLIVSGRKAEQDDRRTYVHRGIAARSFERRFVLGDYVQVKGADMKDGLLTLELAREIPEEMKPKKIKIGTSSDRDRQPRLTDRQDSANRNEHEKAAA
ncbi:MAG TPA: Hsp20 family protein [Sphingomicrobium sp.]|nr:Hsp20 family protein [Sphingomicrobium sp.]